MMEITIQASEFKNKCLQLLNNVQRGDSYLVTKRGVPFAKLSALKNTETKKLFGAMKNSFIENDDIRKPINVVWTVETAPPSETWIYSLHPAQSQLMQFW